MGEEDFKQGGGFANGISNMYRYYSIHVCFRHSRLYELSWSGTSTWLHCAGLAKTNVRTPKPRRPTVVSYRYALRIVHGEGDMIHKRVCPTAKLDTFLSQNNEHLYGTPFHEFNAFFLIKVHGRIGLLVVFYLHHLASSVGSSQRHKTDQM